MPSKVLFVAIVSLAFAGQVGSDPRNPWFSWSYVRQNIDTLLAALREHLLLTLAAVLVATLITIPLALMAYRLDWLSGPILALCGALYTVPSLATWARRRWAWCSRPTAAWPPAESPTHRC